MTAAHPSLWPVLGGVLIFGWMLFKRFRGTVGAQRLDARSRRRLGIRSLILGTLLLITLFAPHTLLSYGAGLTGLLIGAALAFWSLHHTRFEWGAAGEAVRYVPNIWIGGGVFVLLIARLLWRVVPIVLSGQTASAGANGQFDYSTFTSGSPLTYALFAVFVAYQIAYNLGILRRAQVHQPTQEAQK